MSDLNYHRNFKLITYVVKCKVIRILSDLTLILLAFGASSTISNVYGQNCEVDFPGNSNLNVSSTCGSPIANMVLGKNQYMHVGDTFTFDMPSVITINGNLEIFAKNGGVVIIPAGVRVEVLGNVIIAPDDDDSFDFNIVVNGELVVDNKLENEILKVIWSGTGRVEVKSDIRVLEDGCMTCGLTCPAFPLAPSGCVDDGDECSINFCTDTNYGNDSPLISDFEDPVISNCPSDQIVSITGNDCQEAASWTAPTASDNDMVSSFTSTKSSGEQFSLGITTVTYTATDPTGNSSQCQFDIEVIDEIDPVIAGMPADIVTNDPVVSWTAPSASDNCSIKTFTCSHNSGETFPFGTPTVVTYTATDDADNQVTASFTVKVNDIENPVISNCPSNQVISITGNDCQEAASWTAPTASDNDMVSSFTSTKTSGEQFSLGIITVTYTATDPAGNSAQCQFDIEVIDGVDPVITGMPADIVTTDPVVSWTAPSASDNCSIKTFTSSHNSGDTFPFGTPTVVTYTATDDADNQVTASFTVTVNDVEDPVISNCPSNQVVSITGNDCQEAASWTAPTASDNDMVSSFTSTKNSGEQFSLGITTVTYTATDPAGNSTQCQFDIDVIDEVDPVISGMSTDIVTTDPVVSWTAPSASDNCSIKTFIASHSSGETFPFGTPTIVTYTATDDADNQVTASFTVTVNDIENPVISNCPSNQVVSITGNDCQEAVSWTAPTASDNDMVSSFTSTKTSGEQFSLGITTVTYTATDPAGNSAQCQFDIEVIDEVDPVITGMPADIVTTDPVVSWTAPSASDNCSIKTFTSSHNSDDTFPFGTPTIVTYTATDDADNQITAFFTVTVNDVENPVISNCPSNQIVSITGNDCQEAAFWIAPTASDNDSVILSSKFNSGDFFQVGEHHIEYVATDPSGNTAVCNFKITVIDTISPSVVKCQADTMVYLTNVDQCNTRVSWNEPVFSDNCEISSVTSSHAQDAMFPLGTTTVNYEAIDASANKIGCSFNITVNDTLAPTLNSCPENIYIESSEPVVVQWKEPTLARNCHDHSLISSHRPGDVFPPGTTVVVYSLSNNDKDQVLCSFEIHIENQANQSPVVEQTFVQMDENSSKQICIEATDPDDDVLSLEILSYDSTISEISALRREQLCYTYFVKEGFWGTTSVFIEVCDNGDPVKCEEGEVTVEVLPNKEIEAYKAITPDNDGMNDTWQIKNIEKHPENQVMIFDRWGSLVYKTRGYNNENKVFDGFSNTGVSAGSKLPSNTYFYSIEIEGVIAEKGFFELVL